MAAESAESAPPGATLQTQAFRASGQELRALYEDALARRASFRRAGWGLGIFFGVVFTAKLLGLSVHRRRDDYEPDRSLCLSCGRCIESCPVEHQRRRDKPARHTETS